MAGKPARALKAYEKAHSWKELFTLASTQKIEPDAMSDLIEKIAGQSIRSLWAAERVVSAFS